MTADSFPPASGAPGRRPFQYWAQGVAALAVIVLTLFTLGRFRLSLLWGGIFAIVCWPIMTWLARRWNLRMGGAWLPAFVVLGVALVFIIPATLIAAAAASQAHEGAQWVSQAAQNGIPQPDWLDRLPWGATQAKDWWQRYLATPDSLREMLHRVHPEQGLGTVEHVGHHVANSLVILGFALLILFFLLRSGQSLTTRFDLLAWRLMGPRGTMARRRIVGAVRGAMAGLVLVGLGEGVVIGFAYVMAGAPQPLLLGLFTAIACMIPMIGGVAVALSVAAILIKGSVVAAVAVGVFGAIVLFVADHFIRPVLIGGSIRLPFVWVLLGILGGLESWGLSGLFIGPALMGLAHFIWRLGSSLASGSLFPKPVVPIRK